MCSTRSFSTEARTLNAFYTFDHRYVYHMKIHMHEITSYLQAEELMRKIEKEEERVAYDQPDKKVFHLCIVNLVIGYVHDFWPTTPLTTLQRIYFLFDYKR